MQEILHIASEKWKNLSEKSRVVYEEKARVDKEQYMAATRRGHPVAQDSSIKRNRINQESEKPVKYFEREADGGKIDERHYKQIKLENFSVKSEIPQNTGEFTKAVKQESSNTTASPFPLKTELEIEQEILNRLLVHQGFLLEPLTLRGNPNTGTAPKLQIPELHGQLLQQGVFLDQNINSDDKIRNEMMSRLAWIRMMQANKTVEEAIMRKIEEVKALQAQRLVFVHNMFWSPNPGSY